MKPKEKAQELIGRFKQNQILAIRNTKGNMVYPYVSGVIGNKVMEHQAKQYALIAVDYIIEAIELCFANKYPMTKKEYWEEVKQEIKKL